MPFIIGEPKSFLETIFSSCPTFILNWIASKDGEGSVTKCVQIDALGELNLVDLFHEMHIHSH